MQNIITCKPCEWWTNIITVWLLNRFRFGSGVKSFNSSDVIWANGRHISLDSLFNSFFMLTTKEKSMFRIIGSFNCEGNPNSLHKGSTMPSAFPVTRHVLSQRCLICLMTSSNGNIFRVTAHLCGEFTGSRWIPRTKASDAELWCFLWSAPE